MSEKVKNHRETKQVNIIKQVTAFTEKLLQEGVNIEDIRKTFNEALQNIQKRQEQHKKEVVNKKPKERNTKNEQKNDDMLKKDQEIQEKYKNVTANEIQLFFQDLRHTEVCKRKFFTKNIKKFYAFVREMLEQYENEIFFRIEAYEDYGYKTFAKDFWEKGSVDIWDRAPRELNMFNHCFYDERMFLSIKMLIEVTSDDRLFEWDASFQFKMPKKMGKYLLWKITSEAGGVWYYIALMKLLFSRFDNGLKIHVLVRPTYYPQDLRLKEAFDYKTLLDQEIANLDQEIANLDQEIKSMPLLSINLKRSKKQMLESKKRRKKEMLNDRKKYKI